MKKIDITTLAIKNFARRKARSFLTILGVVIGTMAVVIMVSVGEGLKVGMEKQFAQWGSITQINVYQSYSSDGKPKIMDNDAVNELKLIENVAGVMAQKNFSGLVKKGREVAYGSIIGVDPSVLEIFDFKVKKGELLNPTSTDQVLMGYMLPFEFRDPKSRYNEWNNPMNEDGTWKEQPFDPMEEKIELTFDNSSVDTGPKLPGKKPKMYKLDVVGVLEPKWDNFSNSLIMSYDTVKKWYDEYEKSQDNNGGGQSGGGNMIGGGSVMISSGGGYYGSDSSKDKKSLYDSFIVKVNNRENVVQVQNAIKELGYNADSPMEYLKQQEEQLKLIQLVLGGIGAIAFIVAALGITNTMMMSTYERTREIGIMKVMGCRLADIRDLFLTEACIIGFLGGVVGIAFSAGVSLVLNSVSGIGQMMGVGNIGGEATKISIIPIWLIFVGVVFTTIIGLISGFYPAYRAIKLSALEAIKNE